jgi:hypothetical protein
MNHGAFNDAGRNRRPSDESRPVAADRHIEASPDDQIIAARRGLYLSSVAQRTGSWQQQSRALAEGCLFHLTAMRTAL